MRYGKKRITAKDLKASLGTKQGELWEAYYLAIAGKTYPDLEAVEPARNFLDVLLPPEVQSGLIRVPRGWQIVLLQN